VIRVFVADDHAIVRDGLKRLITETPGLVVAGEAAKGREVLQRAANEQWDVLLLDLSFEDIGGLEVLRRLRTLVPGLQVIVLSMFSEEQYAVRVLRLGAAGYLSKGRSSSELVDAIRTAARGRRYITAAVADALVEAGAGGGGAPHESLTAREHDVFMLIAQGRAPGDIAAELFLSPSTVSSHLAHIREKLGVRTNGEIVQYVFRAGLAGEYGLDLDRPQ
jgi:two-component system invasion response regulator UvrY